MDMSLSVRRFFVYLFFACALLEVSASAPIKSDSQGEPATNLQPILDEIAVILHGPERQYIGTPHLCAAGLKEVKLPMRNFVLEKDGGCKLTLIPDTRGINSPADARVLELITGDPYTFRRLLQLLDELGTLLQGHGITPLQKVAVQWIVWDLYTGLRGRKYAAAPKLWKQIDGFIKKFREVLDMVLLSDKEIDLLPATLPTLSDLAHTPEITATIKKLLNPQGGFLEISNPSILHTIITRGRLVTRVFLESRTGTAINLQHILKRFSDVDSASIPGQSEPAATLELKNDSGPPVKYLLHMVPDFHAVFIGFLTVLDMNWKPKSTSIVALWQEYEFEANPAQQAQVKYVDQQGRITNFRSIELRRLDGSPMPQLEYERVPDDRPEPIGILPRNNTSNGGIATTHQDNCARCHYDRVAALDARRTTLFKFETPFKSPVPSTVQRYLENLSKPEDR